MNEPIPLLKVADVAKRLSISDSAVRTLARQGKIRAIKIGSDWRFRSEAVEQFIEESEYRGFIPHAVSKVK